MSIAMICRRLEDARFPNVKEKPNLATDILVSTNLKHSLAVLSFDKLPPMSNAKHQVSQVIILLKYPK